MFNHPLSMASLFFRLIFFQLTQSFQVQLTTDPTLANLSALVVQDCCKQRGREAERQRGRANLVSVICPLLVLAVSLTAPLPRQVIAPHLFFIILCLRFLTVFIVQCAALLCNGGGKAVRVSSTQILNLTSMLALLASLTSIWTSTQRPTFFL